TYTTTTTTRWVTAAAVGPSERPSAIGGSGRNAAARPQLTAMIGARMRPIMAPTTAPMIDIAFSRGDGAATDGSAGWDDVTRTFGRRHYLTTWRGRQDMRR